MAHLATSALGMEHAGDCNNHHNNNNDTSRALVLVGMGRRATQPFFPAQGICLGGGAAVRVSGGARRAHHPSDRPSGGPGRRLAHEQ